MLLRLAQTRIPSHARHDDVPVGLAYAVWQLMLMTATAVSDVGGAADLQCGIGRSAFFHHGRRDGWCDFFPFRNTGTYHQEGAR